MILMLTRHFTTWDAAHTEQSSDVPNRIPGLSHDMDVLHDGE